MATATLPGTLRLGTVSLTVTDLERAVAWYREVLGLRLHDRDDDAGRATLGDGATPVLELVEDRGAQPAGRHAGLFHFALLYPSREELGRAALRLAAARAPITGASDHVTHEAIYLRDLDGNGIELAADRPHATWPSPAEQYAGGPQPLDLDGLVAAVAGEDLRAEVGDGLAMGHVHLHVGDLDDALAFYRDVVGFELQARLPTAAFVSAGGYHHHLAFNLWQGPGVGPAPTDAVGLRHWTVALPAEDVDALRARLDDAGLPVRDAAGGFAVRDPWDIELVVASV